MMLVFRTYWQKFSQESIFFFFNDTATTEIYTLSLHDALPIFIVHRARDMSRWLGRLGGAGEASRSEEHTSELQSRLHLVCRLLLEKKKKTKGSNLTQPPCRTSTTKPSVWPRRCSSDKLERGRT